MFFENKTYKKFKEIIYLWKNKAKERRKEIISLKKRNDELIENRDKWKKEAQYFKDIYEKGKKKLLI